MGQLTVRLTPEQDQQIARVKQLTGEKTATRCLMATLKAYEAHLNEIKQLKEELNLCRLIIADTNNIIENYKNAHSALFGRKTD